MRRATMSDETPDPADEHEHDGHTYELLTPFVVCASNGGPYDDDAYVAGWEMGALAERLSIGVAHLGFIPPAIMVIRAANVPQMELVAMSYGLVLYVLDDDDLAEWGLPPNVDGWAQVQLQPARPIEDALDD
jgi:hypothetical protein